MHMIVISVCSYAAVTNILIYFGFIKFRKKCYLIGMKPRRVLLPWESDSNYSKIYKIPHNSLELGIASYQCQYAHRTPHYSYMPPTLLYTPLRYTYIIVWPRAAQKLFEARRASQVEIRHKGPH